MSRKKRMIKVSHDDARRIWEKMDIELFYLFDDETEALVEEFDEVKNQQYGIEPDNKLRVMTELRKELDKVK